MFKRIHRLVGILMLTLLSRGFAAEQPELRVLFLGDQGHHKPADRFKQLQPVLAQHRIELTYTESLNDLNRSKLAGFDCLLIYANHTKIEPAQEKALLDFVQAGGGFVPLHCASFCFLNSPKYIELVGAQFKSHGTGVFKETTLNSQHPVMKGLSPIESWDESYVHSKHNTNRTVLAERRGEKGAEPYTWVREAGGGRVFYTAWGHDQRTWSNPGFQALVENGIRWASANSPTLLQPHTGLPPFKYTEAPAALPNYVPNAKWGTLGEPIHTMQEPLSPAESMKHLVTLPGFQTRLVASEPDIFKPIWMSWDERGRLWIAETIDYPNNMQGPGEGHDQIKICEDTDGDGKADKFTVFADKLSVPTSFVFANGGIIVVHSGKCEFFKDTNGDDKADERKVLFTGWGTQDTHAGPSNLRYGFDGWIWGTVGYSGFRGTVGGKEIRFGQGIYRFKPDGSALEFVRSSNNNTWGLGISEDNVIFGSTANGNASMYMPIPNRYYETVNGWSASRLETIADSQRFYPITEKVRQVDYHGKYTAGAGSGIYTARSFPQEFWNKAQFVAEPTGHLLGLFYLIGEGTDYAAHNARSFLASDDEWTSPICAEVGPDGALWVIDWYNYIIQHNPTPQGFKTGRGNAYDTPLRDKTHGRIYRVAYEKGDAPPGFKLSASQPEDLIQALKSKNMMWRMTAQRIIVEQQKKDLTPKLCTLVENTDVDEIGLNPAALHALWALHGLGAIESDTKTRSTVQAALKHPSAAVRRAAVDVLPRDAASAETLLSGKTLQDADPHVRMAALLALSEMPPSAPAGAAVFGLLRDEKSSADRWIPDAATVAAAKNDAAFLRAVLASYKPEKASAQTEEPKNLVANPSFETVQNGKPVNWSTVSYNGSARAEVANEGHTGNHSVKITSSQGSDTSWSTKVSVKPRTDYRLSAWIKTENVRKVGAAHGALLNIHELQDPVHGATKPLLGDNDWTQVRLDFNSGDQSQLTVNCLFGGWGRAMGTAWFDDVELTAAPGSELPGDVGRVVRLVTTHYASRGPVESIVATLEALKGADASIAVPVLDGLVAGWPEGTAPKLSDSERASLKNLMEAMPEAVRDRLLALAQRWGQTEIFGGDIASIVARLKAQIADASASDDARIASARRLIGLDGSSETVHNVLEQVTLLSSPQLASGLINAVADARDPKAGQQLVRSWSSYTPAARRSATAVLMRKPEWAFSLLDAVEKRTISRTDIGVDQWSQLKQNPNRGVAGRAERLAAAGTYVSADREEIVNKLLPLATQKGDANHGKEVYTATCAVCHTFNGQGGKVGPDLSGIAAKGSKEILIDILDPNRSVEANYRLWNVTTKAGDTFSGRLEAETQTSIEILDTTGQKHTIQRKDIATLEASNSSLMPNGFEALPPSDLTALLAFLTQTPHLSN